MTHDSPNDYHATDKQIIKCSLDSISYATELECVIYACYKLIMQSPDDSPAKKN